MNELALADHPIIDFWSRLRNIGLAGQGHWEPFLKVAMGEFERASSYELPLSVALVSLDRFPGNRGRWGGDGGTRVLRIVATTLLSSLRRSDVFEWLEGGSFAILFPSTSLANATKVCERLREKPSQLSVPVDAGFPLTLSFGLACISEEDSEVQTLLRRAAKALRVAEEAGGNRLCSS